MDSIRKALADLSPIATFMFCSSADHELCHGTCERPYTEPLPALPFDLACEPQHSEGVLSHEFAHGANLEPSPRWGLMELTILRGLLLGTFRELSERPQSEIAFGEVSDESDDHHVLACVLAIAAAYALAKTHGSARLFASVCYGACRLGEKEEFSDRRCLDALLVSDARVTGGKFGADVRAAFARCRLTRSPSRRGRIYASPPIFKGEPMITPSRLSD